MSLFGFFSPCAAEIKIADAATRKTVEINRENTNEKLFLYIGNETVTGQVEVKLNVKKLEHTGIKVELLGHIELFYDRDIHNEFLSVVRELAPAGDLTESKVFQFEFPNVEKQYESYNGINVRLRYFLKFTITRNLAPNVTKELDLWVQNFSSAPEMNSPIKMEVA